MNPPRIKLLRALDPGHRHVRLRRFTVALTLLVLAAVPAAGLVRFDLLGGQHLALGRRVDGLTGAAAVGIAIVAFYVVTFLLNVLLGRVFCGWGCPVGEAARLADGMEAARPGRRGRAVVGYVGYALALSAALSLWWASPGAVLAGGWRAAALAVAGWLLAAVVIGAHGVLWRWSFCRRYCPIGLYYSAVQTAHGFGIHFDRARGCIDCTACVAICPASLDPRDLTAPRNDIGGLALDDMPGQHHCFTCGDCVRACEHMLRKRDPAPLPLRLGARRR